MHHADRTPQQNELASQPCRDATFFLFAALGVFCIVFCARMVPETRGKTLEQFEDEYRKQYS